MLERFTRFISLENRFHATILYSNSRNYCLTSNLMLVIRNNIYKRLRFKSSYLRFSTPDVDVDDGDVK